MLPLCATKDPALHEHIVVNPNWAFQNNNNNICLIVVYPYIWAKYVLFLGLIPWFRILGWFHVWLVPITRCSKQGSKFQSKSVSNPLKIWHFIFDVFQWVSVGFWLSFGSFGYGFVRFGWVLPLHLNPIKIYLDPNSKSIKSQLSFFFTKARFVELG